MKNVIPYRPGSDELEELTRGYVMANRINDVWAGPNTKRHQGYVELVRDQFIGEPVVDHNDQYREKAKELLPRALEAYETRHGVTVTRGLLYFHGPEIRLAAAPDAVESRLIGLTAHICHNPDTYAESVERGVTDAMRRHAQAMMAVSHLMAWVFLDYFEDPVKRVRRLYEHLVEFDEIHAAQLEEVMIGFLLKTRVRAA